MVNQVDQTLFGAHVGVPDLVTREAQRIAKTEMVAAPARNVTVEQTLTFLRGPGRGVDAVGDRVNRIAAEQLA